MPVTDAEVQATKTILKTVRAAGGLREITSERDGDQVTIFAEPAHRQRLDHYGNNGEGWDSEAWNSEYAGPLSKAIEDVLVKIMDIGKFYIDIGEKGHVEVTLMG